MALAYADTGRSGRNLPAVLRRLASLGVEDLLLVGRMVYAAEKAGEEGMEACARRLFWFRPKRLARGVVLLAELEALAAGEGLPAGRRSGSGSPGV